MTTRSHATRWVRSLTAATVLCAAVLAPSAHAQDAVTVPGTSVTLTPPAGFTVARRGLDNGAGSTITIGERSADAYAELAELFKSAKNLSAGYAAQQLTIRAIRHISTPSGPVAFATGTQVSAGREQPKYLALLKGDKTVLITFNLADRGSLSEADAEALLRSVSLAPAPTVEQQLAGLPFTFELPEPFRVTSVVGRNTVTLTSGDAGAASSTEPVIVIGRGQSTALMGDEARVAVELLKSTGGFREAAIVAQEPVAFAGGAGYVVRAVVEDRTVVQYLRIVPGGAYLRFLARGRTGAMDAALDTITAIAASVEPR